MLKKSFKKKERLARQRAKRCVRSKRLAESEILTREKKRKQLAIHILFDIIKPKLTTFIIMSDKGIIYYKSIPAEIKKLKLTQKQCADMMGVSLSGLTHRIKADKPQFHLAIYGLATYMGQNDGNLKANITEVNNGKFVIS